MKKWFVLIFLVTNIIVAETQLTWQDLQKNMDSWIDGPVSLLLTDQEKDVYKKLSTPEDKMQFVKIFWARRDPLLRTRENEFKQEFYTRVDAANDKFAEGKTPGWKTARGQVYILFGPPSREEKRAVPESSRPAILWIYDRIGSSRIPVNEALVFVYRDIKYVLLPPSAQEGDVVGSESRAMELSSLGYQSIPSVVEQAFADVTQKDIVDENKDYRNLLGSVTTTEKFDLAGIDFEAVKVQDNPLQFKLTLPKETAPVYDAGTKLFLELSVDQEFKAGTAVVASNRKTISLGWDQKAFAGLNAIEIELPALDGASGKGELSVTVRDSVSGISETRKFPIGE